MLALYAAIRKGIYEDEDADEEEMGVLLCVVVVVGIARAGDIQADADGHCRTRSILIGVLQHLSLSLPCAYVSINLTLSRVTAHQILGGCHDFTRR